MTSMHFYGWKNGLKTGQYYLRTRPSRDAIKFTVNIEALLKATDSGNTDDIIKCLSKNNDEAVKKKKPAAETVNGEPEAKKRKLSATVQEESNTNSSANEKEDEGDGIFECLNCSG